MAREPEPLESVRALVCEPCWINCFDTEGFEKLGRGDIDEFEYNITRENIEAGTGIGCTWCSMVDQLISDFEMSAQTFEISLSADPDRVITPSGSNMYLLYLTDKLIGYHCRAELEFFTEHDNLAAQQVTARDVDRDVTPEKTFSQISRWLKECVQHPCCPRQIDSPLPTRLIDVASAKLWHTNGALGKFVALSYCWGTGSQIQLGLDNIETLMQHLDFNNLPQTIKDAVLVTQSLSIRYLWVDALCIIQDDPEDKAHEIGSMAQTYSDAYVTILASSAGDAAHGFLARRYENDEPVARIPFRVAPNMFGSITARKYIPRSSSVKENNPLSTRAWALQEQMMASRTLAYTKHTLEWRCASIKMSLNDSLNVDLRFDAAPKFISQLSKNPEEAASEWSVILGDYSRRSMSIQSDKLPAIAALAERFAAVLGRYHAGLWQYGFIKQLLWHAMGRSKRQRAGNPYRAPSWSWASVDEIRPWYGYEEEEDCANLVSAVALRKDTQVLYGEVVHASIKIRGKIFIASLASQGKRNCFRCTIIHFEGEVAEPPMQRFYKTYFHHDTKSASLSRGSELFGEFFCWWDYEEIRSEPLIVLLLPLRRRRELVAYDRVYGLILTPAGPGTVQRIGSFVNVEEYELGDVVEQEITIV